MALTDECIFLEQLKPGDYLPKEIFKVVSVMPRDVKILGFFWACFSDHVTAVLIF